MNQQVQQKTLQLEGIEALLDEATQLGLVSPDSRRATEPTSTEIEDVFTASEVAPDKKVDSAEAADDHTAIATDLNENIASSENDDASRVNQDSSINPAATTEQRQSKRQAGNKSSPKSKPKSGATARKTNPVRTGKPTDTNRSVPDLRQFLQSQFEDKTFTDTVGEILDRSDAPLSLDDLIAQMYEDLPDQDYKRAKASLANVLSVGRGNGKWRSVSKGLYAGNATATA